MQTYALLNLTDLRLGLEDLLTVRRGALFRTQAGKAHERILEQQRQAINALPPPLTGGRAYAEELAVRNAEHDSFGLGMWHITEAYLRIPGIESGIVEAARRIRAAFIPDPDRLRDPYADQAATVALRKESMVNLIEDLMRIPVAGGGTLFDWAAGFVGAGEQIAKVLMQRAEINATTRKHAMSLHADTIRTLNELRNAVLSEVARTLGMPREIEGEIFGYFDVLEATRLEAKRAVEQNQALAVGPGSTRGITLPPPSARVIPGAPPSSRGYPSVPPAPPSYRSIPPAPPSNPPAPPSSRVVPPVPSSNRGPRNI
ncbi:MAG: hypothetical protein IPM54_00410 [Polyangiaceae bacterium]|nr:hypothetical protein [Polyangiaceae bacterium]